jgi:hypothetical protein
MNKEINIVVQNDKLMQKVDELLEKMESNFEEEGNIILSYYELKTIRRLLIVDEVDGKLLRQNVRDGASFRMTLNFNKREQEKGELKDE